MLFCPLHDQRPTQTDAVAVCSLFFLQHLAIEKGENSLDKHRIKGAENRITSAVGRNGLAVRLEPWRRRHHPPSKSLESLLSLLKTNHQKKTRGAIVSLRGGRGHRRPARRRASVGAPGSRQRAMLSRGAETGNGTAWGRRVVIVTLSDRSVVPDTFGQTRGRAQSITRERDTPDVRAGPSSRDGRARSITRERWRAEERAEGHAARAGAPGRSTARRRRGH